MSTKAIMYRASVRAKASSAQPMGQSTQDSSTTDSARVREPLYGRMATCM